MFKRLFFLISIVLVLSLVGNAQAVLVGKWTFDDGDANDSSGNGHHGTFMFDATTVIDGNIPGLGAGNRVLTLDGEDDHVNCGGGGGGTWADFTTNQMTVACWLRLPEGYSNNYQPAMAKSQSWQWYRNQNGWGIRLYTNNTTDTYINYNPNTTYPNIYLNDTEWHHAVATFDGVGGTRHIYIDGYHAIEEGVVSGGFAVGTYDVSIGARLQFDNRWKGLLDECYLYDHVLTHKEAMFLAGRFWAWDPAPGDGEKDVSVSLGALTWQGGVNVAATAGHKVYIGTSKALVEANDVSVYKGAFDPCSYSGAPMGSLTGSTQYYWRINEVNGVNEWPGDVWSFRTLSLKACKPLPVDGSTYVGPTRTRVSWTTGAGGATKDAVYFGTDKALIDANDPSVYKGTFWITSDPNWPISPPLVADETYYWRIDGNFPSFRKNTGYVWSFETMTPLADANLIGWWPMEEQDALGNVTWDITGNEHHGTFKYDADLISDDSIGLAGNKVLDLDGFADYVNVGGGRGYPSDPPTWADLDRTLGIACWVRTKYGYLYDNQPAVAKSDSWEWDRNFQGTIEDPDRNGGIRLYTYGTTGGDRGHFVNYNPGAPYFDFPYIQIDDREWHHLAATFDGVAGMRKIWIDGKLSKTDPVVGSIQSSTYDMAIGARLIQWQTWQGQIDDVRFYNRVITTEDVLQQMRFDPNIAWNPHPADGDQTVGERPLTLHWRPGEKVQATNEHKVYFGTDQALVDACDASVYQGLRDVNNLPAGSLDYSKWYYWKITEVNGATEWPGKTWAFKMRNYIPWEDFESYDFGLNLITGIWIRDAETGAFISLGTTGNDPVNGGEQSMKYEYDNDEAMAMYYYSEAYRDFGGDPCDWSWATGGIKSLRLYFYGETDNYPDDMYIMLDDGSNQSTKLYDRDSSDLSDGFWKHWDIDLSWFTDGTNNVDLSSVDKVYIGFGERGATSITTHLTGTVYFDDFRVYPPHCVTDRLKPAGDATGDCIVNHADTDEMALGWLDNDYTITPSNPGDSNLVGYWNFDDGTANDSSGNNHHGTLTPGDMGTSVTIVDDADRGNKVLELNNPEAIFNSVVDCGGGPGDTSEPNWANLKEQISIAAWCKVDTFFRNNQYMLTRGVSYQLRRYGTTDGAQTQMLGMSDVSLVSNYYDPRNIINDGQWHHVACTYDSIAEERIIYIDGKICNTDTPSGQLADDSENFIIGGRLDATYYNMGWDGKIDEVRLYDDALTQAEVLYIMTGSTSPVYFPVWSLANLTDVGDPCESRFVNFKDWNLVANTWLDELMWP